jgi:hypothetical protein
MATIASRQPTAFPCATFQRAVNVCQLIDVNGGNCVVQSIDTSPRSVAESISVTNPLRGAGNGTPVPNIGTVWPSQIIIDGNNQITLTGAPTGTCYGIASSNNAVVGLRRITVAPTAASCQDGLFAQLGGGINVFDGVTLGATGAGGCKAHAENSAYGIQFWQNYTLTGNGNCGYSVGGGASTILISAGVGTITGNPTLGELVFVSSGGVFQTNIANPWGGSPGTLLGGGFIAAPGGTIENNGLAVAWPGNGTSYLEGGNYNVLPSPTIASDANIGTGGNDNSTPHRADGAGRDWHSVNGDNEWYDAKWNRVQRRLAGSPYLDMYYNAVRDHALRAARWNFAKSVAPLILWKALPGTPENTTSPTTSGWSPKYPAPPWLYSYNLPTNYNYARRVIAQPDISTISPPIFTTGGINVTLPGNLTAPFEIAMDQYDNAGVILCHAKKGIVD